MKKKSYNSQSPHSKKLRAKNATLWSMKQFKTGIKDRITIEGDISEIDVVKNYLNQLKKKHGGGYCVVLHRFISECKLNNYNPVFKPSMSELQIKNKKVARITVVGFSNQIKEIKDYLNLMKKENGGTFCSILFQLIINLDNN